MAQYKTYLVMFFVSVLGSLALTPSTIRLALKLGAVDIPNARKIHARPIPRMAGPAILAGFCLPWAGLYLLDNPVSATFMDFERRFLAMILAATGMLALGIYDDIRGANAGKKFLAQFLTAIGLWFAGFKIDDLTNPWGAPLDLGWLSLPVSVLWIVGITNALNLLDGIDGLLAGVTAVIAVALAVINALNHNPLIASLTFCLAGTCVGFLPYNRHPARTFLGDSGSLTLGMLLACTSILSFFSAGRQTASSVITIPLILFALPVFDTLRVMVKRALRGVSMFEADRNHVHHRLLSMGMSQRQAAWTLYLVAAGTAGLGVVLTRLETDDQVIGSVLLASLSAGVYMLWKLRLRDRWTGNPKP